jgi:DNA-binding transcriptional MerR regulator
MSKQKIENIRRYLERDDVRQRIYEGMRKWRSEVAVPIGRASDLFGLSENQLRDWEERNLLHPLREARYRPRSRAQAASTPKQAVVKHRHYSLAELDKLVVIRELLQAQYAPGDIPSNIDEIADIDALRTSLALPALLQSQQSEHDDDVLLSPLDTRIKESSDRTFWRFYTSHVLKMALMLISENLPDTEIGLILPLRSGSWSSSLPPRIENLSTIDEALVGWLNSNRTTHTMLSHRPSFQSPADYCLFPLAETKDDEPLELPKDNTLIVLERFDRRSNTFTLPSAFVLLMHRLLSPLYEEIGLMQICFGSSMLDDVNPAPILDSNAKNKDTILTRLADMVIRLGGYTKDGQKRWQFCTILLPDSSGGKRPMQQRNLVVRAQSKNSPYTPGESILSYLKLKPNLGQRAFQSGRIIYRSQLSSKDTTPILTKREGPIRSNIAVPIGSEHGQTLAVLYIASYGIAAFSPEDQQLLRIIGRLIENSLNSYTARLYETQDIRDMILAPEIVDSFFADFLSENDFMRDIENLMVDISQRKIEEKQDPGEEQSSSFEISEQSEMRDDVVSFIGLDLDGQESLANKYGDQIMREMSKTLGLRIQDLIVSLVTRSANYQMYYIFANRYYLILRDISLNKARQAAEKLRMSLEGNISLKQSEVSDSVLIVPGISVHLAVTSYSLTKLREFLEIYPSIADISSKISQELDLILKMGMDEHGNVVMSFDYESARHIPWSSRAQ